MGQKISPTSLRIGIHKDWSSRWFGGARYKKYLKDDLAIRTFLAEKLRNTGVDRIEIERGTDMLVIAIYTARPGLVIGRGGAGVEELKNKIKRLLKNSVPTIKIEIQEIKNPDISATIVAEGIADQVEKRIPFRRVVKQALAKIIGNKEAKGAKIQVGGRLDGAEIARTEHLEEGSLPLQTLRADIDYAKATANTTYGTVGIKVWIYKGDVFDK